LAVHPGGLQLFLTSGLQHILRFFWPPLSDDDGLYQHLGETLAEVLAIKDCWGGVCAGAPSLGKVDVYSPLN